MRSAASVLRSEAGALTGWRSAQRQVARDLRLQAERLEAAAATLLAEANVKVPVLAKLSGKLGIAVLTAVSAFAGAVGQEAGASWLSEHDAVTVERHCATALEELQVVVDMAEDLQTNASSPRERLIHAVGALASFLNEPSGLPDSSDLSDDQLAASAIRFADHVRDRAEARIAESDATGTESDVGWAYGEIRYIAEHLWSDEGDDPV